MHQTNLKATKQEQLNSEISIIPKAVFWGKCYSTDNQWWSPWPQGREDKLSAWLRPIESVTLEKRGVEDKVCLHRVSGCIDFCARTPCDAGSFLKLYKYGPLASTIYPSLHSSSSVLHQHTCLILSPVSPHSWVKEIDFYLRSWPKNMLVARAPPVDSTDLWLCPVFS